VQFSRPVGEVYTRAHVARICKVSARRLRCWERHALVARSVRRGRRPAYAFRDLLAVRCVRGLVEQGVPPRRIRGLLDRIRGRMPELERPVEALRVWMEGSSRVVLKLDGVLVEPDGQTVIDFAPPPRAHVARLAPRRVPVDPSGARDAALAWFERGCGCDADPSRYTEAADAYTRAIDLDPDFADAYCNLGAVRFNQGQRDESRACFQRAIEIQPAHPEAHLNLATLLEEEGCDEAALHHYQRALESDPACADAHVSLALLYERMGRRRRSLGHWRSYLSIDPRGVWGDLARRRLRDAGDGS
jgi:DNA-binding transcriptional MerR regulator/lipoprotein NlpI